MLTNKRRKMIIGFEQKKENEKLKQVSGQEPQVK